MKPQFPPRHLRAGFTPTIAPKPRKQCHQCGDQALYHKLRTVDASKSVPFIHSIIVEMHKSLNSLYAIAMIWQDTYLLISLGWKGGLVGVSLTLGGRSEPLCASLGTAPADRLAVGGCLHRDTVVALELSAGQARAADTTRKQARQAAHAT
jgi:hypothetical protein